MTRWLATALCLALLGATPAAADATLRCGHDLVEVGDTTAQLLLVCGEPLLREVVGLEKARRQELVVEQWTYDFGPGSLLRIVRLEGGVVADFAYGDRR